MNESLNEAVAALRPEMTAALQRLVRKKSVEGWSCPESPSVQMWTPALRRR